MDNIGNGERLATLTAERLLFTIPEAPQLLPGRHSGISSIDAGEGHSAKQSTKGRPTGQ